MPAARPWPFVAVVLALLALLSLAGGSAVGSTEVRPRNAGPEAPSVDRGALRAARHREERARVARLSPRRRAVRRRSRAAYALQSDRRALSTLRHRFGRLLNRRPSALPHRRKGERLGRFVSDVAVEITNGERSALVESMLRMRTRNDRGRMAAVDLGLRDRGRSFVLANPLVDVRVSERIDGGVRLVDAGVGVAAVAANGSKRPRVVAGKLLWPNVDADTDFAVEPTVTGFETFHFLRSARSPERLSLELDLSDGASVRAVTGNTGAFEIVRDGVVVATISAPVAFDAAGDTVSVTAALEHGRLVLSVPHRRADVEYPIAVDPVIDGVVYDNYAWNWESKTEYNGWKYNAEVRPFHPSALDPCDSYVAGFGWGKGLYICSDRSQTYTTNAYAQWLRRPYGHETTIYRADFHDMNHQPSSYSQYVAGIWSDSKVTWDSPPMGPVSGAMSHWSTTNCARNPCPDLNDPAVRRDPNRIGTRNNVAVFRYIKHSGYGFIGNAHLGNAHIYQWDVVQPTFPNPAVTYLVGSETSTAPSTAWHRNAQLGARPSVTDYGLGIRKVELLRGEDAATATPFGTPDATPSCLADPNNKYREPCPGQFATTFRYSTTQLGEGIHTLRARARDYSHNERLTTAWTTKVDSSAPEFAQDPDDFPGQVTNLAETVEVTAADGDPWGTQPQRRSGVKRIDVYLTGPDGVRRHVDEKVASTPACTVTRTGESKSVDHSCPMTMQYTFPRGQDEYRPGEYAAEFVATDWAGNVSLPAVWSFHKLDVLDPEITALKHTPDPLPRGWLDRHRAEVFADAWDPGFSGLYQLDFTEPLLASQQAEPPYRYRSILDKTQPCEGNLASPCPIRSRDLVSGALEGTRSYDTDRWREGIVTASLQVRDAAGHTSKPPSTFQLKVDRMPPSVGYSGPVAENAYVVEPGINRLKVTARDGSKSGPEHERSGTVKLKIAVDGNVVVDRTQTCPDGSCSMEDEIPLDAAALAAGAHTLSVTSEDAIGHSETVDQPLWVEKQTGGVSTVADATGDGRDDLITVGSDGSLFVGASDGGTGFAAATSWGTWAGAEGVTAGDVDGDGDADLVGRTAGSADVLVALSSGSAFAGPAVWLAGAGGAISLADVDSGREDDLILRATDGTIRVAYAEGGAFIELSSWATVEADAVTLFGDVTGDELADLITVTNGAIEVRRTDSVSFGGAEAWGTVGTEEFRLADADGDDLDDLLLRAGDGEITYRRSTETSFAAAQPTGTLAPTYHWSTGDLDGDARADAVGRAGRTVVVSAGTAPYPENDGPGWTPDPGSPEDPDDPSTEAAGGLTTQAVPGTALRMAWADDDYTTERLLGQDVNNPDPAARCAPAQVAFDRMRQPGSTYVRFVVLWSRYVDAADKGAYVDGLRNAVACAQRAGLTPYFTLTSAFYDRPNKYVANPSSTLFAGFVDAVVKEFFPRGVTRYSIWNEPNHKRFLKVQCTGAAVNHTVRTTGLYRSLYSAGYDAAIAASGGRAIVYIGELSELAHKARSACGAAITTTLALSTIDYLERLTTPGTTVHAHGVAWHAYQHRSRPNVQSAGTGIYDTERFQRAITSLHKQNLLRTRTGRKPGLYITEFGYWNVPLEGTSERLYWTESTRAAWSRLALDRAARNGVRLFTFWQLNEAYDQQGSIPLGSVRREFDSGMLAPGSLDAGGTRKYGKGPAPDFKNDHPRAAFCAVRDWGRGSGLPLGPATPAAPLPPGC